MNSSNEELISSINRLLEKLHQAGGDKHGSAVINIYEKGSLHVDHVDNQYFYGDKWQEAPDRTANDQPSTLPAALNTEKAKLLLKKAQDAGYLDTNYQPTISRTQSALLATAISIQLNIKHRWKVFETLWNRKNIRSDYSQALNQKNSLEFQEELKQLFNFN